MFDAGCARCHTCRGAAPQTWGGRTLGCSSSTCANDSGSSALSRGCSASRFLVRLWGALLVGPALKLRRLVHALNCHLHKNRPFVRSLAHLGTDTGCNNPGWCGRSRSCPLSCKCCEAHCRQWPQHAGLLEPPWTCGIINAPQAPKEGKHCPQTPRRLPRTINRQAWTPQVLLSKVVCL